MIARLIVAAAQLAGRAARQRAQAAPRAGFGFGLLGLFEKQRRQLDERLLARFFDRVELVGFFGRRWTFIHLAHAGHDHRRVTARLGGPGAAAPGCCAGCAGQSALPGCRAIRRVAYSTDFIARVRSPVCCRMLATAMYSCTASSRRPRRSYTAAMRWRVDRCSGYRLSTCFQLSMACSASRARRCSFGRLQGSLGRLLHAAHALIDARQLFLRDRVGRGHARRVLVDTPASARNPAAQSKPIPGWTAPGDSRKLGQRRAVELGRFVPVLIPGGGMPLVHRFLECRLVTGHRFRITRIVPGQSPSPGECREIAMSSL